MNHISENVENIINHAMTKEELIEALENVADDTPILFACPYGDCGETQQVFGIQRMIEDAEDSRVLVESNYSETRVAYNDENNYIEMFDGMDLQKIALFKSSHRN